jgi:hypothetical protein
MVSIALFYVICLVLLVVPLAGVGVAQGLASALSGPSITAGVGGTILGNAVAALMAVGGTALTLALPAAWPFGQPAGRGVRVTPLFVTIKAVG